VGDHRQLIWQVQVKEDNVLDGKIVTSVQMSFVGVRQFRRSAFIGTAGYNCICSSFPHLLFLRVNDGEGYRGTETGLYSSVHRMALQIGTRNGKGTENHAKTLFA
jgi:hypothetical protein